SVEIHRQGRVLQMREHARDLRWQYPTQREVRRNLMLREPGHLGGLVTDARSAPGELADEEQLQAGPQAGRMSLLLAVPGCGELDDARLVAAFLAHFFQRV